MKKQYKKPEATIDTVINRSILSTSEVIYGGSNKGKGITTAESNERLIDDDLWEEEW